MDEILKVDTIEQYNDLFGFETLHPLVAIVDLNKPESQRRDRMTLGFYSLFLKETKGCVINYGKSIYDFDAETIVAIAPGQTVGYSNDFTGTTPKTIGLLFHPNFISGTSLGQKIKKYTFFSYESNEALHLSEEELRIIRDILSIIRTELKHAIDKHTRGLICTNIELLLDYCMRFYDRQFITRQGMNLDVLARFERLLDEYLDSGLAAKEGLPTVNYFADKICLSPNYFGDLVKKETGKSAKEYIQLKMLNLAKEELLNPEKSITQVAYSLGFQYPQHFVRFFKKYGNMTPSEYRRASSSL
ncbi:MULTISPECIES: helix-turn-helix domain-containing protein [Parabacteroides]|uniref:helix-turn-helix domain-containing protein n=1 Tax=Parabacteroides TaxID=375288 RepID=UPI00094EBC10|nr:helix-turn-helix domain-containing protein [Parabacteroides timonensis]